MSNEKKYNLFKLIQILKEETDKDHPMSQSTLVKRLDVHRNTVSSMLSKMIEDSEHSRVWSVNLDNELDENGEDISGEDKHTYIGKVYYQHEFTPAELHWLIDGILFSRNVPHENRNALIEKLTGLGNIYFQEEKSLTTVQRLSDDEPVNEQLFDNIEIISKAIHKKKKITTIYCYMGPDYKLQPSTASLKGPQTLTPYAMVARNGFYFLICNNDHHNDLTHYRIDRMTNVKITRQAARPVRELDGYQAGWNLQEYMKHNINMAFGKAERITFIAQPKAIREIIDAFGKSCTFQLRKDGNYDCVVYVPLYDMEHWVLQFGELVTVTGPEELLVRLRNQTRILSEKYAGE